MELKDLILQTIHEIDSASEQKPETTPNAPKESAERAEISSAIMREECEFLELLKERLLVLFDGLNAPHNENLQSSLKITINFLEYLLTVIEERLHLLKS